MADEIIQELWKVKDAIAQEYGCDIKSFVAHVQAKKHEGDKRVDLRSMQQATDQNAEADARIRDSVNSEPSAGAA